MNMKDYYCAVRNEGINALTKIWKDFNELRQNEVSRIRRPIYNTHIIKTNNFENFCKLMKIKRTRKRVYITTTLEKQTTLKAVRTTVNAMTICDYKALMMKYTVH